MSMSGNPWRPACAQCGEEEIDPCSTPIQCLACGAPWDGWEVTNAKPPPPPKLVLLHRSPAGLLTLTDVSIGDLKPPPQST